MKEAPPVGLCWGRYSLRTCAWFSLDSTHAPFLCADFVVYAFVVINLNHEPDYVLSPLSPLVNQHTQGTS